MQPSQIPSLQQAGALSGISGTMEMCRSAKSVLVVGTMLLVIMAALTYAIGQAAGAETRSRAVVWATAMLTGAILGVVIYVVLPYALTAMSPSLMNSSTVIC